MGRAGRGGGGSRSSGSRSSSRSSGGHRSSSRARGSSSSSGSSGGYSSSSYHRQRRGDRYVDVSIGSTHYHGSGKTYSGNILDPKLQSISNIISIVIVAIILLAFILPSLPSLSVKSSYAREKLDLGYNYTTDCIVDEIYWFDSVTHTGNQLRSFFDKTGVQPFIYLKKWDPNLVTDEMKGAWAEQYYEENFSDKENVFLYVYFAEPNTDVDVGYMHYVNGMKIDAMMDNEAVEIFWNYIDSYWYSNMSTDDLFIKVFNKTADTITQKSKSLADVLWICGAVAFVIAAGLVVIAVIKTKRKAEKEKAAETERILNTPMQDLIDSSKNNSDSNSST